MSKFLRSYKMKVERKNWKFVQNKKKKCDNVCIMRLCKSFEWKNRKKAKITEMISRTYETVDYYNYTLSVKNRLRIVHMNTYREFKTKTVRKEKKTSVFFWFSVASVGDACTIHTNSKKKTKNKKQRSNAKTTIFW